MSALKSPLLGTAYSATVTNIACLSIRRPQELNWYTFTNMLKQESKNTQLFIIIFFFLGGVWVTEATNTRASHRSRWDTQG